MMELYILNGEFVWYVNDISTKLLNIVLVI